MSAGCFLALDQSTSATKAILFSAEGKKLARTSVAHEQIHPGEALTEHDPLEILRNCAKAVTDLLALPEAGSATLSHLSITNQRETILFWDRATGKPFGNAVVWHDQRGIELCGSLEGRMPPRDIEERTGLLLDPYFSASKLSWLLREHDLYARAERGEALWGTIESWLVWNLTEGALHVTDYSNASRTLLFNINTLDWDDDLLALFHIPRSSCPRPVASDQDLGLVRLPGGSKQVRLSGLVGDSQGALFGQRGFSPGSLKATYGTGTSVVKNLGPRRAPAKQGLVTSIGWGAGGGHVYVLEGNIHSSGDTMVWLQNNLGILASPDEAEILAGQVPDTGGVYLVPAFSGLGAPYWDAGARALVCGLTSLTDRRHLARAGLESIAYQVRDLVALMEVGREPLMADGGASRNRLLMQLQADLLNLPVSVRDTEEASALGAGLLGGLGTGLYRDLEELRRLPEAVATYEPVMGKDERNRKIRGWREAVARARLVLAE